MAFLPGNKFGKGRPRGSINAKANTLVRDIIEGRLGKSIPERLLEISRTPKEEREALIALLPYTYRKLQAIEVTGDDDEPVDTLSPKLLAAIEFLKEIKEIK